MLSEVQPIDDELHFLLQCAKCNGDGNNLLEKLINLCHNFDHLDSNNIINSFICLLHKEKPLSWWPNLLVLRSTFRNLLE